MAEDIVIEEGSGNIFKDLGFSDEKAKEEWLKAQLGAEIFGILERRQLTQTEAAKILGVKQPEISRLKSGKFSYYSVERLMRFLDRLGCEVSIHIVGPEREEAERVMVI
ncbi:helix-turn-helix domain-containing protein [Candidatus Entotheonella palauensis]|uniref:helix-turn-helix domain-containing protein n=1 Tax=Candidatus Entotheonella palauensis TaxID=93172 RepID=UPI000B7E007F|nr:helix-turn-helix transcriptional regulator [Candidatus Entotheonella palauensis]